MLDNAAPAAAPVTKFHARRAWTLEYRRPLVRVYEVEVLPREGFVGFVARCDETGEWLAYDSRGKLHSSYGKTRSDAADLLRGWAY